MTITTGVEGLRTIPETHAIIGDNQMNVVVITLIIVCILFVVQRAGTSKIGRAFGPVMLGWFLFLGITGLLFTFTNPKILLAINPVYGLQFLFSPNNHAGIMILGSCFLATTGAEALYSDMGHVGKGNIYATWPFVKACLILSYLGQGAWLLANAGNPELAAIEDLNPFFQMLPGVVRPFGVVFSVLAAIIAPRRSSPARSRSFPRRAAWTSCRTCRCSIRLRPRASSTSRLSTRSCGRAASSWCCCSRALRTWRRRTAWPSPSRCFARRCCSSSTCVACAR